jgi:alpha-beta hydrolase superfamily lysophospholipase
LAVVIVSTAAVSAGDVVPYPQLIPVPPGSPQPIYKQISVPARDGTKLNVHEWSPAKASAGAPVFLFIHGIGMHGAPYGAVAAAFTARGITLVIPDLRGHGRSEGERGVLAEPHVLRADVGAVIARIHERRPRAPVVLAGDSMGGLLAADYAWRGEQPLAGLVLLVPAFAVHPARVQLSDGLKGLVTGRVILDTHDNLALCTREPGFIKAKESDALALHEVKPAYLQQILQLQLEVQRGAAHLRLPLCMYVAGDDQVIDNLAAQRFFAATGTPRADKTWRQWTNARHTLCWDPVTKELIAKLAEWVAARAK